MDDAAEVRSLAPRDEVNVLPVVGGSTDVGFGGGVFSGLAHIVPGASPDATPYAWNLEGVAIATLKPNPANRIESPMQDVYVLLTIPRLLGLPVRLAVRPSWTWERTLGFYGVGNATTDRAPPGASGSYFQYGRTHPALDADLRFHVVGSLAGIVGARYTQSWLQIERGSRLDQDLDARRPEVGHAPASGGTEATATFRVGVQWDDRDSVVAPHRGTFHEVSLLLSPGGSEAFPYRYGQANLTLRAYAPLGGRRLTLATRLVLDAQFGDVPFYELSRFDDTYAIGGALGVRGVPGQRYSGKIKAIENVEVRFDVAEVHALGKALSIGGAAFFDVGRVWSDVTPHPELDGTGLGLKWGAGAGPRLRSGEAFVVRADLAWSPDARPIGGYFTVGHLF